MTNSFSFLYSNPKVFAAKLSLAYDFLFACTVHAILESIFCPSVLF